MTLCRTASYDYHIYFAERTSGANGGILCYYLVLRGNLSRHPQYHAIRSRTIPALLADHLLYEQQREERRGFNMANLEAPCYSLYCVYCLGRCTVDGDNRFIRMDGPECGCTHD
jgi:hypothetical protein